MCVLYLNIVVLFGHLLQQEALLWQRDCATRLSVEILQIPFETRAYRVALFA